MPPKKKQAAAKRKAASAATKKRKAVPKTTDQETEQKTENKEEAEQKKKNKGKRQKTDESQARPSKRQKSKGTEQEQATLSTALTLKTEDCVEKLLSGLTDTGWREALSEEFAKPYFQQLAVYIAQERKRLPGAIFPAEEDTFSTFNVASWNKVKVVVLGQDPYFRPDDPDLPNFTKKPKHGYLLPWAEQGVLLLNAVMTVQEGKPNSHKDKGWEEFTTAVIKVLNDRLSGVVFLLWGGYAQKKGQAIDRGKHLVLEAPHPSPMSGGAWLGNRHFSKCNAHLQAQGKEPIDWSL